LYIEIDKINRGSETNFIGTNFHVSAVTSVYVGETGEINFIGN